MTRPRALLSVHDKSGLIEFARGLVALNFELVASGGTGRALAEAGLAVTAVETVTGFPELLGGRVKTLHPAIHAGILSRRSDADQNELRAFGLAPFDLVAVTLYPFDKALAEGADDHALIEEIDIGGVALLRAAAKSFRHVTVVPGPAFYAEVLAALHGDGDLAALRRRLAAQTLTLTSNYDQMIAGWLAGGAFALRYGENPHQSAAFIPGPHGLPFRQLGGKELSYNNLLDLDAAWAPVLEHTEPAVAVIKHGSPSGLAINTEIISAWVDALASDPVSAFGGVVTTNRPVDLAFATALGDLFLEVIAAPAFDEPALAHLRHKKKNCRLLAMDETRPARPDRLVRTAVGGLLVQSPDAAPPDPTTWQHVAGPAPDAALTATLAFAFHAVKHVKSNAIVLARSTATGQTTVGIGGGQTNRIDAVHQAITRAGTRTRGAVLASDAFFPFADGVLAAAEAGVTAVVQPGGALKDAEVIAAAEAAGLTMVFTGRRHFRH